jgi:hypothetical protein
MAGMMLGGQAYEHQTSGHRIAGKGFSLSPTLPTPVASDTGTVSGGSGGDYLRTVATTLLPTPSVAHVRNHDEPLEDYLQRRKDYEEGRTSGMPGASLGVAIRLEQEGIELFQTPVAVEGDGGAVSAELKKSRGHFVMLRDQIYDLFPTPKARDSNAEGYEAGLRRSQAGIGTVAKGIADGDERITGMLPTPRATRGGSSTETQYLLMPTPLVDDAKNTGHNKVRRPSLATETFAMGNLLPTPLANASKGSSQKAIEEGNPKNRYAEEVEIVASKGVWGKYAPAIERWELALGRPAPAPTRADGKNGNHRLSPEFTEWMMGLPLGWITDAGLRRNEELKACGNGVVPQQAAFALSILMADLPEHIKLSTVSE